MFDLHMHTELSDGALSVNELLETLETLNISTFSITDHNHAKAYDYIDMDKYPHLLTGAELATSFEGYVIEVHGYGIDPKVINQWYDEFYSDSEIERKEFVLFNKLTAIAVELGYTLTDSLTMDTIVKGISKKTVYNDLVKNHRDFEYKTYKAFFRQALCDPKSPWFANEDALYPSFETIINLIHDAHGFAILAHPYEYGFDSIDPLIDYCIKHGIDGFECFHPSAAPYQSIKLAKFCSENNLKGSGGSDFHSTKRGIPFGVHILEETFDLPCFNWIKEI